MPHVLLRINLTNKNRSYFNEIKKIVKFDYPPVKSMKQFPRHDPENLKNLFFTEQELDQIEYDRYSTMSTDDIEIVAVTAKNNGGKACASKLRNPKADDSRDPGLKSARDRDSTPIKRRPGNSNNIPGDYKRKNIDGKESDLKASTRNERMVKGVQIFLRERSMGI